MSIGRRAAELIGETIAGRYVLTEVIGDGGMGNVYKAAHAWTGGPVAMKVLDTQVRDGSWVRRFRFEAEQTASLLHPNTVRILDFGPHEDLYYLAMEYLPGIDLSSLLVRRGQPPGLVAHVMVQVLGSLAEAHAHGLVHRDVKPSNIMLLQHRGLPDFVKVIDFGIARTVTGAGNNTDGVLGTMGYLSPEQIADRPVDARTDLYSLGCVAFELLTGQLPFPGIGHESPPMAVLEAHLNTPPSPLRALKPTIHPELARVVMRMLNKNPVHRPPSADALLDAVRQIRFELARERAHQEDPRWMGGGLPAETKVVEMPAPQREGDQTMSFERSDRQTHGLGGFIKPTKDIFDPDAPEPEETPAPLSLQPDVEPIEDDAAASIEALANFTFVPAEDPDAEVLEFDVDVDEASASVEIAPDLLEEAAELEASAERGATAPALAETVALVDDEDDDLSLVRRSKAPLVLAAVGAVALAIFYALK